MSGAGDTVLFESIRDPRPVVFVVWMLEDGETHPRWKRWCAVHATQQSAEEYLGAVRRLDTGSVYGIDQEWLIGG